MVRRNGSMASRQRQILVNSVKAADRLDKSIMRTAHWIWHRSVSSNIGRAISIESLGQAPAGVWEKEENANGILSLKKLGGE